MTVDRNIKGGRTVFVTGDTDANLNRLLTIVSSLTAEVAVLRDRLRTMEKLLDEKGTVTLEDVESFEPGVEDLAERGQWQADYMRRVYYILERQAEEEAAAGPAP